MEDFKKQIFDSNIKVLSESLELYSNTGNSEELVYLSISQILDVISNITSPGSSSSRKLKACHVAIDRCTDTLVKNLRLT